MKQMISFSRPMALVAASLFALLVVLALGTVPVQAQREPVQAGVAAAVRGDVQLARAHDGTIGRRLDSGEAIFMEDVIAAGPRSGLQIMLMDETVFTVGANSEIVIDTFIYDPETSVGKISARILKGTFRFTTGLIGQEDPESVSIGTPLGTIGIRGTIVAGVVEADSALIVLIGPGDEAGTKERVGRITVSNDQGTVDISRGGFGTTLTAGAAPTVPVAVPETQINALLSGVHGDGAGGLGEESPGATQEAAAEDGEARDSGQDDGATSSQSDQTAPTGQSTGSGTNTGAASNPGTTTLTGAVGETSVGSLSGVTIAGAVSGATSTDTVVAAGTSSNDATEEVVESSLATLGEITTLADLTSVTTGTAVLSGNGTLSGTMGSTGTFSFTGQVNFGSRATQFSMNATWSGTNSGSFDLNAGPSDYLEIFTNNGRTAQPTDTFDTFNGAVEGFDTADDGENNITGEQPDEQIKVDVRMRNIGNTVVGALDTSVSITETGNGEVITGSATATR
jgi:hypothetical protein